MSTETKSSLPETSAGAGDAEKASRDNFDSNAIEQIERAMQRADRVLFPERYLPNVPDEPRHE